MKGYRRKAYRNTDGRPPRCQVCDRQFNPQGRKKTHLCPACERSATARIRHKRRQMTASARRKRIKAVRNHG